MLYVRTELEAVNTILRMVGESPINSTAVQDLAPGALALTLLRQISRSVQSQGWYFNTREDITCNPGVDGKVLVSANTVGLEPSPTESRILCIRDNALFDVTNETFVFTSPVRVTLLVALDFDELPESMKEYITMLTGLRYTGSIAKSDLEFRFSEDEVNEARSRAMAEELRNQRYVFAQRVRRVF